MRRTLACTQMHRHSRGCVCLHMNAIGLLVDMLTWLGIRLPACGHADMVRDMSASLQTCWRGWGHIFPVSRCVGLHVDMLA